MRRRESQKSKETQKNTNKRRISKSEERGIAKHGEGSNEGKVEIRGKDEQQKYVKLQVDQRG